MRRYDEDIFTMRSIHFPYAQQACRAVSLGLVAGKFAHKVLTAEFNQLTHKVRLTYCQLTVTPKLLPN